MSLSWYPITEGKTITSHMLNEMIESIENGSIFAPGNITGDLVRGLAQRVTVLEAKVAVLELQQRISSQREQFILSALQNTVDLIRVPSIDTEILTLNGLVLSRDNQPSGTTGDYVIVGSVITLTSQLASQIIDGDRLCAIYDYEVIP